jgi:hypothetical protein
MINKNIEFANVDYELKEFKSDQVVRKQHYTCIPGYKI